jgi:TolA-binding protein
MSFLSKIPFIHNKCKQEICRLIQAGLNESQKIQSLNSQINKFVNQIQELKAVNDYQMGALEKKIADLEEQYRLCKIEVDVLEKETNDGSIGTTTSE